MTVAKLICQDIKLIHEGYCVGFAKKIPLLFELYPELHYEVSGTTEKDVLLEFIDKVPDNLLCELFKAYRGCENCPKPNKNLMRESLKVDL